MFRRFTMLLFPLALPAAHLPAHAGAVNPDISVIGQPFLRWSDGADDPARKRVALDPGETEFVFDADLNPYAHGTITLAFGEEGGALEEAYFQLTRGLPGGLALKGGRYRAGFGRLNAIHPHAYPFAERFGVLAAYLPGEESFNEVSIQASRLVPLGERSALTASADWLQGDSFRAARESSGAPDDPLEADPGDGDRAGETRPGVLGRLAAFFETGEASGLEVGVSGTRGTRNVAAGADAVVLGADFKAKWSSGPRARLVVQGEWLHARLEEAAWDEAAAAYAKTATTSRGGYVFADYAFDTRYNAGVSYERFQPPHLDGAWAGAFGVFAGLALMEETTAFRIGWHRLEPGAAAGATAEPVSTVTLRVVYAMGPHRAHRF